MLKINSGSRSSKAVKKNTKTLFQRNLILFLIPKAKIIFQKLKKIFCKELVLQYFEVFKLIRLKSNASKKAIGSVLCQKDKKTN